MAHEDDGAPDLERILEAAYREDAREAEALNADWEPVDAVVRGWA